MFAAGARARAYGVILTGELVGAADFRNVNRVLQAFLARPAVIRGLDIPKRT